MKADIVMKEHMRKYLNNDSIEADSEMEDFLLDNEQSEEIDVILKELWNKDITPVSGVDKMALANKIIGKSMDKTVKHSMLPKEMVLPKETTAHRFTRFGRISVYIAASILLGIIFARFWPNQVNDSVLQIPSHTVAQNKIEEVLPDVVEATKKEKHEDEEVEEVHLPAELVEINVPEGEVMQLNFKDGSVASVEGGSKIAYDQNFTGDSRLVTLNGRASFSVVKSEKPFIVNNSNINLRVVGTEFYIDNRTNKDFINVRVDKGEVLINTSKGVEVSICAGEELLIFTRKPNEI